MATAHDQSDDEPRQASPDNPLFVGKLPAGRGGESKARVVIDDQKAHRHLSNPCLSEGSVGIEPGKADNLQAVPPCQSDC